MAVVEQDDAEEEEALLVSLRQAEEEADQYPSLCHSAGGPIAALAGELKAVVEANVHQVLAKADPTGCHELSEVKTTRSSASCVANRYPLADRRQ